MYLEEIINILGHIFLYFKHAFNKIQRVSQLQKRLNKLIFKNVRVITLHTSDTHYTQHSTKRHDGRLNHYTMRAVMYIF